MDITKLGTKIVWALLTAACKLSANKCPLEGLNLEILLEILLGRVTIKIHIKKP